MGSQACKETNPIEIAARVMEAYSNVLQTAMATGSLDREAATMEVEKFREFANDLQVGLVETMLVHGVPEGLRGNLT